MQEWREWSWNSRRADRGTTPTRPPQEKHPAPLSGTKTRKRVTNSTLTKDAMSCYVNFGKKFRVNETKLLFLLAHEHWNASFHTFLSALFRDTHTNR